MSMHSSKYRHARSAFRRVKSKHRLYVFYDMQHFPPTQQEVEDFVGSCLHNGVANIIPRLPRTLSPGPEVLELVKKMYAHFAKAAGQKIHVGLHLDTILEQSYYLSISPETAAQSLSQSLIRREYYCDPHETVHMPLHGGTLMALLAYEDETASIMDLRSYVKDGFLDYTVPSGNWTIEEYICTSEPLRGEAPVLACSRMSTTAGMEFLDGLMQALGGSLTGGPGLVIQTLYVSDLSFQAPNRRNWDVEFNQIFTHRFGFDPAPFYPALYHHIGEQDAHIKALFMDCRAEMLRSGYLCALKAFSDRYNIRLIISNAEPKLPSCSWLCGDALANQVFSPCAVQEKSYLYGLNSTHLATAASDNYGSKFVACEMFRDYTKLTPRLAYKDTLNVFGHGANLLMAHMDVGNPLFRHTLWNRLYGKLTGTSGRYTYPELVARIQSLLRGGSRVNDIAMLYPIYALHDKVYLYETPANGHFEYPHTPYSCNYMAILNTLSTYAGQDVTLLHPQVLNHNCTVHDGTIELSTRYQTQHFRVLILPGADMVSLENMRRIRTFYDEGGKVLAVGELPRMAFEFDRQSLSEGRDPDDFTLSDEYGTAHDLELRQIVCHIFGNEVLNTGIIRDSFYHANEKGGEAYYLISNRTGADGCELTDCASIHDALQSFHIPLDVYMPHMPRFESNGAFNTAYSDFTRLGLVDFIPGGGMISHIHKRRDNLDIFFFANTTDRAYHEHIYLRGIYAPSRWDPQTGKARVLHTRFVRNRNEIYTRIHLCLPRDEGVFLVSDPHPLADRILASASLLPDVTEDINMMERSNAKANHDSMAHRKTGCHS